MTKNATLRRSGLSILTAALALASWPGIEGPRDQGIGGTGVVGIVTAFGSVFVNGLEIVIDPSRSAPSDLGGEQALQIGQVVRVVATGQGRNLIAQRIAIEHAVIGPVEAIDTGAARATVLGQSVDFSKLWDASPIIVGRWVAVSGFRDDAGVIHASLVEEAPEGPFAVSAPGYLLPSFAHAGKGEATNTLRGQIAKGAPIVTSLSAPAAFPAAMKLARLSLEGYFSLKPGQRFSQGGSTRAHVGALGANAGAVPPKLVVVSVAVGPNGAATVSAVVDAASAGSDPASAAPAPASGGKSAPPVPTPAPIPPATAPPTPHPTATPQAQGTPNPRSTDRRWNFPLK